VLNLDENGVADWGQVEALEALPRLEALHLCANGLRCVRPPRGPAAFAALRSLLLGANQLADWCAARRARARAHARRASVDALDAFPALAEARLSGNPVCGAGLGARHEVVARVRRLALLNGALVGRAERRDAEIRYLRRARDAAVAGGAPVEASPRLAQLQAQLGDLASGGGGGAAPAQSGRLADALLPLRLRLLDGAGGARELSKRLPRGTSAGALAQLCARLFRAPPGGLRLALRRSGGAPEPLLEPQRDLDWLGAQEGDVVECQLEVGP